MIPYYLRSKDIFEIYSTILFLTVAKPSKDGTNSRPILTVKSLTLLCNKNNIIFCIRIGVIYTFLIHEEHIFI